MLPNYAQFLKEEKEVAVACGWNGWDISKDNKTISVYKITTSIYINTSTTLPARIRKTSKATSTTSASIYVINAVFKRKN
jgi:hypothetical protein